MRQVCAYSASFLDVCDTLIARLHASVRIVHKANFDPVIVKIQEKQEKCSTNKDKRALKDLKRGSVCEDKEDGGSGSSVQQTLKQPRTD